MTLDLQHCIKKVYDTTGVVLNQGSDKVKSSISALYHRFVPRCRKQCGRYSDEYYPMQCWQGICWCSSIRGRIDQNSVTIGNPNCPGTVSLSKSI